MGFRELFLAVMKRMDQRGRLTLGAWGKPRQGPRWLRTRLDRAGLGERSRG